MTICIIPARSGSKRIKNKNIRKINNIPMLGTTIQIAKKSNIFKRIIVSTDTEQIAKIAMEYGAEVPYLRSKKLANDFTATYEVLIDIVKKLNLKEKYIFCLYPTAIFTKTDDLKKSFLLMKKKKANLLCPVIKLDSAFLRSFFIKDGYLKHIIPKYKLYRSQDLPEVMMDAGSFYIYNNTSLLKLNKKKIEPSKSIHYLLNKTKTLDINYPEDLKLAKILLKNKKN
tara:strand:+ start:13 stop:693 length:681 start_codon:yes stop_codon:yes gene_type:complete